MDLKEKYFEEIQLLKNQRINRVVQAAKIEFQLHGIMNAKIKDIAKRAEVGEASVYRYFVDKQAMVKVVAFDYWNKKSQIFFEFVLSRIDGSKNGLEQLLVVFDLFIDMYYNHIDIVKFMEDYENYMEVTSPKEDFSNFESFIMSLKDQIFIIIGRAKEDGSINKDINNSEIYEFMSQALLSTIQSLVIRKGRLQTDKDLDAERLLKNMKTMFIKWIKE